MAATDLDLVRHALGVAREQGFAEVEIASGDLRFSGALEPRKRAKPASANAGGSEPEVPALLDIKSPLVGYYREVGSLLKVGNKIEAGTIVAAISALGLMTEVEATQSGEVVEVLVQPDGPVEYGQVLARVKA